MTRSLLEALGYKIGMKAAQAKNAFDLMGGGEEESTKAEIRLGHDMAAAVLKRVPLVESNEGTAFAEEIGRWLTSRVTEKKLPFKVRVTAEEEPNAMALPGGPVFISWPLLELCQGERDEIAFLIGHEMAHIILRHTLDRIVKDAAISLLLKRSSGKLAASSWLNQSGRQVLTRAFSRENELEADLFSAALVQRAGGDPAAARALLERVGRVLTAGGLDRSGAYLSSHPPLRERIDNLAQLKA